MKRLILALCAAAGLLSAQTTTPNLGLNLPAAHSTGWNTALNNNFTLLDQYLSAVSPIPALSISGKVLAGSVQLGSPAGPNWTTDVTIPTGNCVDGSIFSLSVANPTAIYQCVNSAWTPIAGTGGIDVQTGSYTVGPADFGKLLLMNCATACTVTLPNPQPQSTWYTRIQSVGTATATVVLGSAMTFNGSTTPPVLNAWRELPIFADSTNAANYEGEAPLIAGTGITFTTSNAGLTISTSGSSNAVNLLGGTTGALPYQSATGTTAFLSGNTTATDEVVVSHGTGSAAQAPTLTNAPALSGQNFSNLPAPSAGQIQSSLTGLTNCNTSGYAYSPQSNSCISGGAGGSSATALPPYLQIGSNYYLPSDSMYQATRPNGLTSWTTLNASSGSATITNLANESTTLTDSGGTVAWYEAPTAKTGIELVANWNTTPGDDTDNGGGGIWVYDSTNSKLYVFKASYDTSYESITIDNQTWTYNGVSNPSFSTNGTQSVSPLFGHIHLKGAVSGTSLTFSWSSDGGASYVSEAPITVGTIGGVGIMLQWGTLNVLSVSTTN